MGPGLGVSGIRSMVTTASPPKNEDKPQMVRHPWRIRRKCCPYSSDSVLFTTSHAFHLHPSLLRNRPTRAPINAPDTKVVSCTAMAPPDSVKQVNTASRRHELLIETWKHMETKRVERSFPCFETATCLLHSLVQPHWHTGQPPPHWDQGQIHWPDLADLALCRTENTENI